MTSDASTPTTAKKLGRPDIEGDRERLWDVLSNGGIAIVPDDLGYGICAGSPEALRRINQAKRRGAHKRKGLLMGDVIERELHILDSYKREIIDCVTKDYDLPLGVIARFRPDHPLIQKIDPSVMEIGSANGTIATALNTGGPFNEYIAQLSLDNLLPIFGSSANLTGMGGKARVEDIEPEIIAIADIVLNYGLRRYHMYKVASTQINFETMQVNRFGACYELIQDVLKRHFDWDLPDDPGRGVLPNGIVNEFALAEPQA